MITEERVLDFIRSFGVDRGSEALHMIEKEAIRDDVPIIRKESGELLRILLQIKKPEKILEVGAAIGFSSVFMGENTDNNTHIAFTFSFFIILPLLKNIVVNFGNN